MMFYALEGFKCTLASVEQSDLPSLPRRSTGQAIDTVTATRCYGQTPQNQELVQTGISAAQGLFCYLITTNRNKGIKLIMRIRVSRLARDVTLVFIHEKLGTN